jgi:hypothetical protein
LCFVLIKICLIKNLFKQALELKKVDYNPEQVKQIEQQFQDLLQEDQGSAPGKISAFWKRMIKHADKVFTFLNHPNVPQDNNGSE